MGKVEVRGRFIKEKIELVVERLVTAVVQCVGFVTVLPSSRLATQQTNAAASPATTPNERLRVAACELSCVFHVRAVRGYLNGKGGAEAALRDLLHRLDCPAPYAIVIRRKFGRRHKPGTCVGLWRH